MTSTDFIFLDYLQDISICDDIIEYHRSSDKKRPGEVVGGVVKETKDSIDVGLESGDLANRYIQQLDKIVNKYIEKFSYCDYYSPWTIVQRINIQHYKPGGGFKKWHCERGSIEPIIVSRHLVFMTYLNDVTDAGETEWFYQNLKVAPKKGLTVIWPADWTYTHRGIVSPSQDKYIITGWFNFIER